MSETLIERLRRTKTERLMRPAFGGIMLDMEDERQALVNPDGPEAADYITDLEARLASSPDDVERVARIIDPRRWEVLDGYLADVKRKYRGENAAYDPANFKDKASLAKAREIIATLKQDNGQ